MKFDLGAYLGMELLLLLKIGSVSLHGLHGMVEHVICQWSEPRCILQRNAAAWGFPKFSISTMKNLVNTSHQHMVLEGSGWAESDTCTLPAEQPQIGTIITEIRYVMMSLINNHFPVCLWVTIVSEHWKPWSFAEAASCRKIRSSLKSCYSALINKGWSALFYFFNDLLLGFFLVS